MDDITIYTGIYKDESGEIPIEITNDAYELLFTVEGLKFSSTDLEEWELINEEECSEEQLDKFSFSKETIPRGANLVTKYLLKDCELFFSIPQPILDNVTIKESIIDLNISIIIEETATKITLLVNIGDINEEIKDITDFDFALKKINNTINRKYTLFNCYNCRYSSYNVYGQSLFGSLQCYKKHKERFLKIKDKVDYIGVQNQGYETVQETYYCNQFQLPSNEQFLYK